MPWKKILDHLFDQERHYHEKEDLETFVYHLARVHAMFERHAKQGIHSPIDNAQLLELVGEYNLMVRNLPDEVKTKTGFYRVGYRGGRREDPKVSYDASSE